MNIVVVSLIIENASFVAILLLCLLGAYSSFKRYKTMPGADLLFLGFLLYGLYALLAFTGSGFTGSYFDDFSKLGKLSSLTYVYFVSFALRLGLIFVIVGLFRVARGMKA